MPEASRVQDSKFQQQELLESLNAISKELEQGSIEALYGLKKLLRGPSFRKVEFSKQVEPRVFTVIWLLHEFVWRNLWANFGGDTMTGFPREEGMPYINEISKNLGQFIQETLFRKGEPIERLIKTIGAYFTLLYICEEKLKKGEYSPDDWCVL